MTNKELIAGIANESGMTQVDVAKVMDALAKVVAEGVAKNDKLVQRLKLLLAKALALKQLSL